MHGVRRPPIASRPSREEYLQLNQPPGVPPLPLTGERTLPDVPEENYWYRRHLVVYEWIAARVAGLRVVDMACGEGYGSERARRSRRRASSASTPTRRRTSTPGCATRRPNLRFERDLVESFAEPCDAVVFLQTIEHVQDAGAILEHFKSMLGARRRRLRLDPEPADPGAARGREVRQPLARARVPRGRVPRASARTTSPRVELLGLFHARKLRVHELAIKLGWDRVHKRLGLTKPFYDRFTPAIAASDFALGKGNLDAHWTSSPSVQG